VTQALASLQQAAALAPNEASIQLKLGAALLKSGDRNGGLAAFKQAGILAPWNGEIQYQIGEILRAENNLEAAMKAYQQALAVKPDLVEVNAAIGELQLQQENYIGAIVSFRKVVEKFPDNPLAHFNLGRALQARGGREKQAITAFEKARDLYEKQGDQEKVREAEAALGELKD
jgi:tetratricopeptide (TPR) repeat protein